MPPWEPPSPQQDASGDLLYDVYEANAPAGDASAGQFGIGRRGSDVVIVSGLPGSLLARPVTATEAIGALRARLRERYRPVAGQRFFNPRAGAFSLIHPDLCWKGARVVLVSRQGHRMPEAVERIAAFVSAVPTSCILREEVDAWRMQQSRHVSHVVAFDDHPVWALLLAELVHEHCWDWRAGPQLQPPPMTRPSAQPAPWVQWLQQCFAADAIRNAQDGFRLALQVLSTTPDRPIQGAGLSGLF